MNFLTLGHLAKRVWSKCQEIASYVSQTNLCSNSVGLHPFPLSLARQIILSTRFIGEQYNYQSINVTQAKLILRFLINLLINNNNCFMIAARLQQTLSKRVDMIEGLLLIYSYSELVTVRICDYSKQNAKMYEKETTLIQTCKNLFRIDQSFRKLFFSLCCKILTKINSKYRMKTVKSTMGKIHGLHSEFVSFFKSVSEYQLVRFLSVMELHLMSQSELFYILVITLVKYLKSKTDAIIAKLREKCSHENIDFYEEHSIKKLENQYRAEMKTNERKKRITILQRKSREISSIPLRKYHSQQQVQRQPHSQRNSSNDNKSCFLPEKSCFQQQKSCLETKKNTKIDARTGLKKFQQVYAPEWQRYYTLISPLKYELEQINFKPKRILNKQRREWIFEYFNSLYQESLSRNRTHTKYFSQNSTLPAKIKYQGKLLQKLPIGRLYKNEL